MYVKIKGQSIERLNIKIETINLLKYNNITEIWQLTRKTKTDLKNIGIVTNDANKIEVELELLGLCLRNSL